MFTNHHKYANEILSACKMPKLRLPQPSQVSAALAAAAKAGGKLFPGRGITFVGVAYVFILLPLVPFLVVGSNSVEQEGLRYDPNDLRLSEVNVTWILASACLKNRRIVVFRIFSVSSPTGKTESWLGTSPNRDRNFFLFFLSLLLS